MKYVGGQTPTYDPMPTGGHARPQAQPAKQ